MGEFSDRSSMVYRAMKKVGGIILWEVVEVTAIYVCMVYTQMGSY